MDLAGAVSLPFLVDDDVPSELIELDDSASGDRVGGGVKISFGIIAILNSPRNKADTIAEPTIHSSPVL